MTEAQREALTKLCERYGGTFVESEWELNPFDLPDGYVAGWVKNGKGEKQIYVGCSADGSISS